MFKHGVEFFLEPLKSLHIDHHTCLVSLNAMSELLLKELFIVIIIYCLLFIVSLFIVIPLKAICFILFIFF